MATTKELIARLSLIPGEGTVQADFVQLRRLDRRPVSRGALGRMGLGTVHRALEHVLASPIAAAHLGKAWAYEAPKPGRPGRDDLHYAKAALAYVEALKADPRRPVKHMVDTSPELTPDEVRARLRRARERELLTGAPKGRPGGELTEKAKKVLHDAGLLTESTDGER